jgi:hypothetical protein
MRELMGEIIFYLVSETNGERYNHEGRIGVFTRCEYGCSCYLKPRHAMYLESGVHHAPLWIVRHTSRAGVMRYISQSPS